MSRSEAEPGAAVQCATHPNVETYLRCGQCGKPICPRCLVMTPVGAKCRACARPRRLPTFELSPLNLIVAVLAMLVTSVVAGAVGSIILRVIPLFMIVFPFAVGLGLGEIVSRVVNRKRHLILRVIAGVGVVISYLILSLGDFLVHEPLGLLGSGMLGSLLFNVFISLVENPFILVFLALGIWVAAYRAG
ncbi:MAG: B-box zinc finger protein [Chloroflexota bacterium]